MLELYENIKPALPSQDYPERWQDLAMGMNIRIALNRMKSHRRSLSFLAAFIALIDLAAEASPSPSPPAAKTLSWSELSQIPLPPPGERIVYGAAPQQFGELRLPKGDGPFPVIVLIHGGCWLNAFDYAYMTRLAAWFADHGVASWTIEYRRLGDEGGGWPETFLDVARATDQLKQLSRDHPIDPNRVFAAGHSAGGQLALWLAGRAKLPAESELFTDDPVAIRGVLGLAAITDLAHYRVGPADSCHSSVDSLLGGTPDKVARRYAETSPSERLPLGIPQIFIHGERDPIVEPASVRAYIEAASQAGDDAVLLPLPAAGHFESSVVLPANEDVFAEALRRLLEATR